MVFNGKKTELLAPAGSKEAFIAALRAGADAVYLGVENYNARLNATSLNLYDLEVMAGYARERGARTYLAFNTLIKNSETADAFKALARAAAAGPDGVIVQDLGLARVIREQFPSLELHASTQMAVHNLPGVETLAALGFRRAVLARELSYPELKIIARGSPLELEVFCHGALCFSVSGMCLFSSAIGGSSGNRGRCTQPCRRLWKKGEKKGYLFSPRDLELAGELPRLRALGIRALKIEGRMRSSEYVYRVVKAYRTLLDAPAGDYPAAIKEAGELLSMDFAREKTTFLFSGSPDALFAPESAQCLGARVGRVVERGQGTVTVESGIPLQKGDRIRVSDPARDKTKTLTLSQFTRDGDRYTFALEEAFPAGAALFKAGDASWDEKSVEREVDAMFRAHKKERAGEGAHPAAPKVRAPVPAKDARRYGERLWIKIDDPGWLPLLPRREDAVYVCSLTRENMHRFKDALDAQPFAAGQAACELTPYLSQREVPEYRRVVDSLVASGVRTWVLNNLAHRAFFDTPGLELAAGPFLYCWNAFAAAALREQGITVFTASWEEDFPNLRSLYLSGVRDLVVYLFGFPPLARSRMLSREECAGETVSGTSELEFRTAFESGSGVLVPAVPLLLFDEKEKLERLGVRDFGLDLSFVPPDKAFLKTLLNACGGAKTLHGGFSFNFRRGVR